MSKELEDLINFISTLLNARLSDKHFINVANNETWLELSKIKLALLELKSIKESNPSEALESLERLEYYHIRSVSDLGCKEHRLKDINTVKQALLKAQEPKHYLKWEDLEFKEEAEQPIKVKIGNAIFRMASYRRMGKKEVCIGNNYTYFELKDTEEDKQFFNDLHLERVEE